MEKTLHKRIKLVSLLAMILFSLGTIAGILILRSEKFEIDFGTEEFIITWIVLMVFPVMSISTSYATFYAEKTKIRKAVKIIFYLYPIILILSVSGLIMLSNAILVAALAIPLVFFSIIAMIHLFVYSDAGAMTSTIVFTILIIIGILLKRFHIAYSGVIISMILFTFIMGSFMFGIRCLYIGEKNKYFKNVTFWGSLIITMVFMGMMWKLQHWPGGGLLMNTTNILIPLATIIFLLTLPSSGFTEWKTLYKKIIMRLLIPWILTFLLFIFYFLLPEVHNIIWSPNVPPTASYGFDMPDYEMQLEASPDE